MKAMILAAGLGTRLRPYSLHTPKALFTVSERPVLEIAIERMHKAGFKAVIINTHYHHHLIEAFIAERTFPLPIITRHEVEILGTGGGIRNVADFWEDDCLLVMNTDVLCDIDLAQVYGFHRSHAYPVTMVMHDYAQFNSVHVDADDFVTGFEGTVDRGGMRTLAFTGIHVLDRRVLDFLPPHGPAHIIDAYREMLAANESIKAFVAHGHRWYDIGTPQSYVTPAYDYMAPMAFENTFRRRRAGPIEKRPLQGDGSDRRWYRLVNANSSLIMADHGIRSQVEPQEVDAFVRIGKHLTARGIPVPRIVLFDRCAGLVFVQDLGDNHLQTILKTIDENHTRSLYRRVIDQWITMAVEGHKGFDTAWTYQTPYYDQQVILKNECRYFVEAFLQNYLNWKISYNELQGEFEQLAQGIALSGELGFLHRDFQSRNIMIHNDQIAFIDYQGGRMGPIQYDLASLLIDPYVSLSEALQNELLAYGVETLRKRRDLDQHRFIKGYRLCAVSRNLQILGAFAFLSGTKGKTRFENYIPQAAKSLKRNLSCLKGLSLPKLERLAKKVIQETKKLGL
jgi:NDP-sugar pyrophosphorylase family protein/tRNA A-37 threonylcarbamoyl transferase component Bud32